MKFANTEFLTLFPSMVWKFDLDPAERTSINGALTTVLQSFIANPPGTGETAQTEQRLHQLADLQPFVTTIRSACDEVLKFLEVERKKFAITGCWANVCAPGSSHKPHAHPNNFLSGVYYMQSPEGGDAICFHDPRPQTSCIKPPVARMTAVNTDHVFLKTRPGTLLLFPAWLSHSVPPNTSQSNRINVAFNMMFADFAESVAMPLWTGAKTD